MRNAIALLATLSLAAGCTTGPTRYEQTWTAVVGAMKEQGVSMTHEDPKTGDARGTTKDGNEVTASVRSDPGGRITVQFNTKQRDQVLINRISEAYDRWMGR